MKPHIVGAIFARGGSKDVPRKNLRLLSGKPLLGHAIETALACQSLNSVIVSTDDEEIAHVAQQYGAETPFMRPKNLAQDDSPEWLSWRHALRSLSKIDDNPHIDILVIIPTTAPLRSVADVEACITLIQENTCDGVITVTPGKRSPHFNMITLSRSGHASLAIPPSEPISVRQSAPVVYDMTTVAYAVKSQFVLESQDLFEGKIQAVIVPAERALDIDSELDLEYAEFLLRRQVALQLEP